MESLTDTGRTERRQFQVVCCLGRGGFGEVYRAVLFSAGGVRTEVAIKVLHADADPRSQAVQRLRDEGRLLGAIQHPSVLRVYDLCLLAGRVGLVTEYVDGQDLDKLFHGDEPLGQRALLEVIGHVASALEAAWSTLGPDGKTPLHLIHRDIKPANIRIGSRGEVKLLDFGIARANVSREAQTESHALLGSYLYMAPERFLDDEAAVTTSSDVFALGCTWFEALTRKRLFADFGLQQVYLMVLNRPKFDEYIVGKLAELPRSTDARLVELLRGMLEFEPTERPWPRELSRICQDLAEELPGRSLPRWASSRTWPAPRTVQGVLDGEVITEAAFDPGTDTAWDAARAEVPPLATNPTLERPGARNRLAREPTRSVAPPPEREARARPRPVAAPPESEERTDLSPIIRLPPIGTVPVVSGSISRRLQSPGGRVAIGLAMGGTAGFATLALGVLGLLLLLGGLWWGRPTSPPATPPPPPSVAIAPPSPAPKRAPPTPAPAPAPVKVRPAPVIAPPPPTPEPVAQPIPVPVVAPPPAPVAPTETGTVAITGGVLVELRQAGVIRRPGVVPVGSYEVWADVEGVGNLARITTFRLDPDARILVTCSKLRRECHVQ